MTTSERKARVKVLKALLASDDDDRVERAVALGPEPLLDLLDSLPKPEGLGFRPFWRVRRDRWPHIQQTLGAVVMAQRDAVDHDGLHRIVPPSMWAEGPFGDDAQQVVGIPFVRVPAAATEVGSRATDAPHARDDRHPVVLSRDLWVAATPVTFWHWEVVVGVVVPDVDPDTPAFVRHSGAVRFCNALSEKLGLAPAYDEEGALVGLDAEGVRLLTEAEWEHAARGGTTTATFAGDIKTPYGANPHLDPAVRYGEPDHVPQPPVATRLPNAYGLYDMAGLVWERVQDEWSETRATGIDPVVVRDDLPDDARGVFVRKGGAYRNFASLSAASARLGCRREKQAFRVAWPASPARTDLIEAWTAEAPAVATSPWSNIALEVPHARPRALHTVDGHTWVGVSARHETRMHGVYVADANLMEVLHELRTPFLVSDLHVAGDALWASLGPGHVFRWPDRGMGTEGVLELETRNAPVFGAFDGQLVIGTHSAGFGLLGGRWIPSLASAAVVSVAMDAERLYGGYEDKKVRVFDRETGRRIWVLKTGSHVSVGADGTVWVANRAGTVTAHDPGSGRVLRTIEHEKGSPYAVFVAAWGGRVLTWDGGRVQVTDADGARVLRWSCPAGARINAVFPIDADLHVAVADTQSTSGRVIRLRVP
jgi:formylglycine-generating enzyme required for sulfatase activity